MLSESERTRELGCFGEMIFAEWLQQMGYVRCRYLGGTNPCFDYEAYKGGQKFLFAVKTRNRTTCSGATKNDDYNLHCNGKPGDPMAQVRAAEEIARSQNAIAVSVAVTVDAPRQRYDIRIDRIDDLPNKRVIPMSPKARRERHRIIAENEFDPRIKPEWSNVRPKREMMAAIGLILTVGVFVVFFMR